MLKMFQTLLKYCLRLFNKMFYIVSIMLHRLKIHCDLWINPQNTCSKNICTHFRYKLTKTLHFQRKKVGRGTFCVFVSLCKRKTLPAFAMSPNNNNNKQSSTCGDWRSVSRKSYFFVYCSYFVILLSLVIVCCRIELWCKKKFLYTPVVIFVSQSDNGRRRRRKI